MTIELKIRFDGSTPGLSEHRLSLSEFQDALSNLLQAVRRTATNMEQEATEYAPTDKGRYTKNAGRLDLHILGIEPGSAQVCFSLESNYPIYENCDLFESDRLADTMLRLVDHIDRESKGVRSSLAVRKYLNSIPESVKSQVYSLSKNDEVLRTLEVGTVNLVEEVVFSKSRLLSVKGVVVGVFFDDNGNGVSVDFKSDGTYLKSVKCSPENTEKALEFRGKEVSAQIVKSSKGSRLVTLWLADSPPVIPSDVERMQRIMNDWDETLRGLAK